MSMTDPVLPYGLRDVKIALLDPADDTAITGDWVDLPVAQTFSFTETEETEELRGDDKLWAVRGKGPQVEWDLEAGGISLEAYAILSGANLTSSGVTPARKRRLNKKTTHVRPWFQARGQMISESGGDLHTVVFKCRVTGNIEGEFSDGGFEVTSCSGMGIGNADDDLWDFIHHETEMTIETEATP